MLGFFLEKTLRNEQGKINVLVAGGLEAVVEFTLQHLPNSVAVRLDDHAAFDNLCRFGHVALQHHVLIPRSKVFRTRSNWGFSHCSLFFLDLPGSQSHPEPGRKSCISSLSTFTNFRSSTGRRFPLQFDLVVLNGGTDEVL